MLVCGLKIRAARQDRRMTMAQLAQAVGVQKPCISKIETSPAYWVREGTFFGLLRALHAKRSDFQIETDARAAA